MKFLCGTAVSVYQNSGDPNTNWARFEKLGKTAHGDKIGAAADFWNRYEEDIQLAANLACNSFRLSLEWSRIVPRRGEVDLEAVKRYHQIFDALDRRGMEALVTLHHFTAPAWFEDVGGFEEEANIGVFVDWAVLAYQHFGHRSRQWATFNEPAVATMCGYIMACHPPAEANQFQKAGKHLMHMLRSHAAAYRTIKSMPGGEDAQVGLVHNVFWTEAAGTGPVYAHAKVMTGILNKIWANDAVIGYLKTGYFHYWNPWASGVKYRDPQGRPGLDFIGLNHYSRGVVDWKLCPCPGQDEIMADMGYPIYPPSLYKAIAYVAQLDRPIYVMENGIPDATNSWKRELWIRGYLEQVERAVRDGYDVRGFMYWTLIDNFEWHYAWDLRFGLYEWNDDGSQKRILRKGSACIKELYQELPDKLGKLLERNLERRRAAEALEAVHVSHVLSVLPPPPTPIFADPASALPDAAADLGVASKSGEALAGEAMEPAGSGALFSGETTEAKGVEKAVANSGAERTGSYEMQRSRSLSKTEQQEQQQREKDEREASERVKQELKRHEKLLRDQEKQKQRERRAEEKKHAQLRRQWEREAAEAQRRDLYVKKREAAFLSEAARYIPLSRWSQHREYYNAVGRLEEIERSHGEGGAPSANEAAAAEDEKTVADVLDGAAKDERAVAEVMDGAALAVA